MKKAVKKWRMSKSTSSNGLQGSTESEKHDDEKPEKALSDTELANVDATGSLGKYFRKSGRQADSKKIKTQLWSSVATIVLVEAKDLMAMDDNGLSDPYVKFRLGNEKYKSKWKAKTLSPKWLEQFDLRVYDEQSTSLELSVWDHDAAGKDDFMGRSVVDLSELEPETTHALECKLEDTEGYIKILLSISGMVGSDTTSDLSKYVEDPKDRKKIVRKYGALNSLKGIKDVGWLQIKVIKAQGLASADIGGKSDPFCVLELVNDRLQTHTEYKTLCPEWGKVFNFNVKDIHSILEVTVYDEDRDKKVEFLGKVAIPLIRIRNKQKRWYQLKDKKGMIRTKGGILLEFDFVFNHFKAAIRTFNPREDKYMQPEPKFKLSVLKRNIDRVSKLGEAAVESGKFIQSCFSWESKLRSASAFAIFLIIVWNFELYMLPITLLIVFLKNLLVVHIVGNLMKDKDDDEYVDEEDDDDEEDKEKKKSKPKQEEKKSFKDKIQQVQEICLQVQEGMDMAASMGERVKNTFNWTVPWLSWLAIVVLTIGTTVLYYVPIRYLIMAWGINKFTKKLRAPNAIPNNELMDYLSRVPSDKELIMYRELRPDPSIGTMKKKKA